MKVKICGLTNPQDIAYCASSGVNGIGLLLAMSGQSTFPSSDWLSHNLCLQLANYAKQLNVCSFLLVHSMCVDEIVLAASLIKPTYLQIQSDLTVDAVELIHKQLRETRIVKTLKIPHDTSRFEEVRRDVLLFDGCGACDGILLDSPRPGSGIGNDWDFVSHLKCLVNSSTLIVAGGISSSNFETIAHAIEPDWIDVMSSVTLASRLAKDTCAIDQLMVKVMRHRTK